jgi:hypothetical protein
MTIDPSLNDAYISLRCSLFQYVGENSPWTATDERQSAQKKLRELIESQRRQIARLADLISEQTSYFDQGSYPTEYTDLQYLSLSYLLGKIVADQQGVSKDLDRALAVYGRDTKIGALLEEIQSGISSTIDALNELAAAPASAE